MEKGGILKLYTFGEDVDQALEIESQVLAAEVRREVDGEFTPVDLMPMPRPSDPEDRTTQFFGKLPERLRGSPLAVRIASIEIGGSPPQHLLFDLDAVMTPPTAGNSWSCSPATTSSPSTSPWSSPGPPTT